jgi:hypothetical protein
MLHVTSAAGTAIAALASARSPGDIGGMRIWLDAIRGDSLTFSIVAAPGPRDEIITAHGDCRVFVAPEAAGEVSDRLLDAEHSALGYRFTLYRRTRSLVGQLSHTRRDHPR